MHNTRHSSRRPTCDMISVSSTTLMFYYIVDNTIVLLLLSLIECYRNWHYMTLHLIFTSIVQSVITYALPSFAGQLSKGDKSRINALFHKALKRGLCHSSLDIDELIITADKRLFSQISNKAHCIHNLLPPQRNVRTTSSLRTRGHNFTLSHIDSNLHKNSFINRCLFHFL